MYRVISFILMSQFVISNAAFGACDFSKDVAKNEDGSYTYSRECHLEVGKQVKQLELKDKQIDSLEKVVDLKDLALTKQHERVELWMDTTYKLETRVNTIERLNDTNKFIWFGIGVLTTVGAGFAIGAAAK